MSFNEAQLVTSYGNFKAEVVSFKGELMELNVLDRDFNMIIGNSLTCLYHNKYMESRLLRKVENQLFLFVPQPAFTLFDDRRDSLRIDVALAALLINKDIHIPVKVTSVSFKGIGFTASDNSFFLNNDYHLAISSDYLSVVPHIKIKNQVLTPEGARFGAKIIFIQHDSLLQLKKFIMYHQILFKPHEEP